MACGTRTFTNTAGRQCPWTSCFFSSGRSPQLRQPQNTMAMVIYVVVVAAAAAAAVFVDLVFYEVTHSLRLGLFQAD